ncbi:MAG: hypothetical protein QOH26_924 [Actinomycetota bacterium]|jgi:hypothetical protein|nr:hypothetical protein [Actinomycetota bacterium]
MIWHVSSDLLERYARDDVDAPQAFSIEAHLLSCEPCRANTTRLVDVDLLERLWSEVRSQISAPPIGSFERVLVRLGIKDYTARLLAATPSLRRSWILAVAAVLLLAVAVADRVAHGYLLFLTIAPMLPLAGVAAAYGPGIDPTYEVGIAAPMRSFRLLLIRTTAVLATTVALSFMAALLLPGFDWKVAAWLLPSLALVTSSLALATAMHPLWAAGTVALAWIAVTGTGAFLALGKLHARDIFGSTMQIALLCVIAAALTTLMARRDGFEKGDHQ